jgi:hypothetical protein
MRRRGTIYVWYVFLHVVVHPTNTQGLLHPEPFIQVVENPAAVLALTPSKIEELKIPFKWTYSIFFFYVGLMYCFKGCAIFLYSRITYVSYVHLLLGLLDGPADLKTRQY